MLIPARYDPSKLITPNSWSDIQYKNEYSQVLLDYWHSSPVLIASTTKAISFFPCELEICDDTEPGLIPIHVFTQAASFNADYMLHLTLYKEHVEYYCQDFEIKMIFSRPDVIINPVLKHWKKIISKIIELPVADLEDYKNLSVPLPLLNMLASNLGDCAATPVHIILKKQNILTVTLEQPTAYLTPPFGAMALKENLLNFIY